MFDSALSVRTSYDDFHAALSDILAVRTLAEAHRIAADTLGMPMPAAAEPKAAKAKPPAMNAEQFYLDRLVACRNVTAACGENWHLVPGAGGWAAIPARLRSFKTERGTRVAMLPSLRLPATQYWPHGLPAGVEIEKHGERPAWLVAYLAVRAKKARKVQAALAIAA
jgi:hypothetical protein